MQQEQQQQQQHKTPKATKWKRRFEIRSINCLEDLWNRCYYRVKYLWRVLKLGYFNSNYMETCSTLKFSENFWHQLYHPSKKIWNEFQNISLQIWDSFDKLCGGLWIWYKMFVEGFEIEFFNEFFVIILWSYFTIL